MRQKYAVTLSHKSTNYQPLHKVQSTYTESIFTFIYYRILLYTRFL